MVFKYLFSESNVINSLLQVTSKTSVKLRYESEKLKTEYQSRKYHFHVLCFYEDDSEIEYHSRTMFQCLRAILLGIGVSGRPNQY